MHRATAELEFGGFEFELLTSDLIWSVTVPRQRGQTHVAGLEDIRGIRLHTSRVSSEDGSLT